MVRVYTLYMKKGRVVEELHHFQCAQCNKWWSVGDAPKIKQIWFCPWCGEKNTYLSMTKQKSFYKKQK